ncbi:malate dehydrogenase, mitochondrial-like [Lycorma delicatula]|uniref:malate dehydrogenase, mitochondrial-like n=1 Tax=Lycorma delicatula TaxID=130591 RepID=UPI003F516025
MFMIQNIVENQTLLLFRNKSDGTKVVLINAFDAVGISTAYLLKKTNLFSEICLQDFRIVNNMKGVVADLNNINTPSLVTYKLGRFSLEGALKDADIVVMLEKSAKGRESRKNNQKKNEEKEKCISFIESSAYISNKVFSENAELCANVAELYAKICPGALLAVTTKPINSTIPLICKVAIQTNHNVSVQRILGFMSLDTITANQLFAKRAEMKYNSVKTQIIGGSSVNTIIPLFSQIIIPEKNKEIPAADIKKLTEDVRKSNESHLLELKAPLATAAAVSKFVVLLANVIKGEEIKECVFVATESFPGITYICGTAQLGPAGVEQMLPFPDLSEYEKLLVDSLEFYLKPDIKRGAFLRLAIGGVRSSPVIRILIDCDEPSL